MPFPDEVPASPKWQYRSRYRYLGCQELTDPAVLRTPTPFEVALRLIDFSPLRDYPAAHSYTGRTRGQVPFDPVSLFLCVCLWRELNLSWRGLANLLAGEHGAGWRRLFGFREGETPSEVGLRYFFKRPFHNPFIIDQVTMCSYDRRQAAPANDVNSIDSSRQIGGAPGPAGFGRAQNWGVD